MKVLLKSGFQRVKRAFAGLVCVAFLVPALVLGGTEAQIKIEQAKVMFSEGKYDEALELLDDAVGEEPQNGEAYHYAGLCMMAKGKPESAVSFLSKAAALEPDNASIHEDLAWARAESGDFKDAVESADRALELDPASEPGRFYKAQGLMGQRRFDEALTLFKSVLGSEVFGQAANYYAGQCLMNMGQTQEAAGYFEQANELDPGTEIGRKAGEYARGLSEDVPAGKPKPWSLRMRLLYQHDTNIVPVHDEDFLPEEVSDMDDGRGVFDIDARYKYINTADGNAYVRYTGYGSWQFEETDLNIMFHRGELGGSVRSSGGGVNMKLGCRAHYVSNYVDNELYSDNWRAIPEYTIYWAPETYTRINGEFEGENFDEPGEDDNDRDNTKWTASIYQHFLFSQGKLNTWIGYGYGQVTADGDNYNRANHKGYAGAFAVFPNKSLLSLSLRFEERDYPDNSFDRYEKRYVGATTFQTPLYEALNAYAGVIYMSVDANEKALEYERWIYTIGLVAEL